MQYTIGRLYAKFKCDLHGEDEYVWTSKQVQVELKVILNCVPIEMFYIQSFSIVIILLREEGKSKLAVSFAKDALASGGSKPFTPGNTLFWMRARRVGL